MLRAQVDECRFSRWYPQFRSSSIKSTVIPLSKEFVEYLKHAQVVSEQENQFPELAQQVKEVIALYGGKVFPKLNWSSPKDASWMLCGNTLMCQSFDDIVLLLKSSDFVAHDLSFPYEHCDDVAVDRQVEVQDGTYELVLRQWYTLHPSNEFRCFVRNNEIIGISQRDTTNYYPFLKEKIDDYQEIIFELFEDKIQGKFADPSFVLDIYINPGNEKAFIMDFNPFGPTTDPLLFRWESLSAMTVYDCRIVKSEEHIPKQAAYAHNRFPREVFDYSKDGETVYGAMARIHEAMQEGMNE
ncbi:D123-domain-containing protein [Gorgonomyces haynaldii]|nr:D123-domain-containing protein [Gorgonomyces haynaldii]